MEYEHQQLWGENKLGQGREPIPGQCTSTGCPKKNASVCLLNPIFHGLGRLLPDSILNSECKNTAKRNKNPLVYGTADMTSPY